MHLVIHKTTQGTRHATRHGLLVFVSGEEKKRKQKKKKRKKKGRKEKKKKRKKKKKSPWKIE